MTGLDIKGNRLARKWSERELFMRVLWRVVAVTLFRCSPRIFWGWRNALLRLFGAKIGTHVHIYPTVLINCPWNISIDNYAAVGDRAILYALGPVHIGSRTTVSQGAHLCAGTHDYRDPTMPLLKLPIHIGDEAWICADAFVGPGVNIGPRSIIGARAVVVKNAPPDTMLAGNPARIIRSRD